MSQWAGMAAASGYHHRPHWEDRKRFNGRDTEETADTGT